jgi:hypothetical protein
MARRASIESVMEFFRSGNPDVVSMVAEHAAKIVASRTDCHVNRVQEPKARRGRRPRINGAAPAAQHGQEFEIGTATTTV